MTCDENTLLVTQGDDVLVPITFTDTDITGCTVYLAIESADGTLAVDLRQTTHTDPEDGETLITIPRATTAAMTPEVEHTGTIRMKSAGGAIATLGFFAVEVRRALSVRAD